LAGKRIERRIVGIRASLNIIFFLLDSAVSRLVEKRKSGFAKDIHIQWGVIFPCTSSIFTKNHIQTPMERILDCPVLSDGICKFMNILQRSDEISCKYCRFIVLRDS